MNHVSIGGITFQTGEQKCKGPELGFVFGMVKETQKRPVWLEPSKYKVE